MDANCVSSSANSQSEQTIFAFSVTVHYTERADCVLFGIHCFPLCSLPRKERVCFLEAIGIIISQNGMGEITAFLL
jgi:hypothetical protein